MSIRINSVEFEPNPLIGWESKSNPDSRVVKYRSNYLEAMRQIVSGEKPELDTFRALILNDLWFLLYFIVKPFADDINMLFRRRHPFNS